MKLSNIFGTLAAAFALTALLAPQTALAQLESGIMAIYQNGKEVGRIYVPGRAAKADTYVEHWLLYPNYTYPGRRRPALETVIVPLDDVAASLTEFKQSAGAEPGSKLIQVLSHETDVE